MNDHAEPSDNPASALYQGDRAAAASEWVAAVASWQAALATPDRNRAEVRLRWFLDAAATATNTGHRPRNVVVAGAGAAAVGTGLVLMANEVGNFWRDAFTVIAWVLFFVAAGCGVLYAYQHPALSEPPLTSTRLVRARQLAEQLDAASATMPTGPRLPT